MTQLSITGAAAVCALLALSACSAGAPTKGAGASEGHGAPDHAANDHASADHASSGHAPAAHEPAEHVQSDHPESEHDGAPAPHKDEGAHWTYADQSEWRQTSPDAAACAVGGRQSPINLYDQPGVDAPDLDFAYAGVEANFFNNGHTLQVVPPPGLALNAGGKVYALLQAHFHSPSEHRIDGESFGLEIHFAHKTPEGRLGVVGVVFREGRENPALAALFARIPAKTGEAAGVRTYFDPSAFLPARRAYFQYDGSLTTPPCTEGVLWRVMREPIEASAAQIAAFREAAGENARDLQPINGRPVSLGE